MINYFSHEIIWGQSEYIPGKLSAHECSDNYQDAVDCSDSYQNLNPVVEYNHVLGSTQVPLSDIHKAAIENLKDQYVTKCYGREIEGGLSLKQKTIQSIYERNQKKWTEEELDNCTWHPRIKMFWKAYQCNEIFALSIVPKDASKLQTWYAKSLISYYPNFPEDAYVNSVKNFSNSDTVYQLNPANFKPGFIKPFQNHSSEGAFSTIDLDNLAPELQIECLSNPEDVDAIVQQDYLEHTQDVVKSVLNSFLEDSEASHIGLLMTNPNQQKIYTKG